MDVEQKTGNSVDELRERNAVLERRIAQADRYFDYAASRSQMDMDAWRSCAVRMHYALQGVGDG